MKSMASKKRKHSEVDGEVHDGKKRLHVNYDENDIATDDDDDDAAREALVRKLSLSPTFIPSQAASNTEREAGVIEEVRLVNFMSHSKLNFK